jgi:hypothetical protein
VLQNYEAINAIVDFVQLEIKVVAIYFCFISSLKKKDDWL